ncbi:MAG: HAD family phosphatase [Candidatus Riflebacteria bacterium]|nr:HAD family phosphatase [Candidatus Riflebacteria bacterium]
MIASRINTEKIQLFLFDYGNVISRFDNSVVFNRIIGEDQSKWKEFSEIFFHPGGLSNQFESGKIGGDDLLTEIEKILGKRFERKWLKWAFCDYFTPITETTSLIRSLKEKKFHVGLLSNTNILHYESEISVNTIFPLFDQVTLSFEIGYRKPQREIFLDAINKFGGSPEQILYLDDIFEYVNAASELGIQTLHCDNTEKQICNLKQLLQKNGKL